MELYNGQDLEGGWVSEKFDGVQGVWDGAVLRTRTGNEIAVPAWWTKHLPNKKLVGELWIERGRFDEVRAVIQTRDANESYWQRIRFLVFDPGTDELGPYAEYIVHLPVIGKVQIIEIYQAVLNEGGEGVVFMMPSGDRFKQIPVKDDDGELIGFKEGRGRNAGRIGTFILKLRSGRKLNLGNGLDDALRKRPPKVGSIIKFSYRGLTSTGLPRFAAFAGIRAETSLNF